MNGVMVAKRCKVCNDMKSIQNFGKHVKTKDGYQTVCKDCQRNTSLSIKPIKLHYIGNKKICTCCKVPKDKKYYYNNTKTKDGLMYFCKDCFNTKYRKNKKRNKTTIQTKQPLLSFKENPPLNPTSFTIKDGFTISKDSIKKEPTPPTPKPVEPSRIEEVVSDVTLAHLIGSFIKTGVAIVKHIIKDIK